MVRALGRVLSRWSARWVPDPFVIAILLTALVVLLAWLVQGVSPLDALGYWGGRVVDGEVIGPEKGLWKLLGFGMQMCLILVTGHALASAPAVRAALTRLADVPDTPGQAYALTAIVAMVAGLLNWGLGLVVGALLARDVGLSAHRRGLKVHYPVLGAAGYTGLLVWHGGLSGSAPLKMTQMAQIESVVPSEVIARTGIEPLGFDELVLSPMNLTVAALLLVGVPLILRLMAPKDDEARGIEHWAPPQATEEPAVAQPTPAQKVERSFVLAALVAVMGLIYLVQYFRLAGVRQLDPNVVNLSFLVLGVALHGSLKRYGDAIADAARGCAGIILQFPFYAGIMGIMALSGLDQAIASGIAGVANETTYGPLTFASAGIVNLFVPSGGGQWGVQAAIVLEGAMKTGVPYHKAIMAFCYGDQWTNMLQPFWALPLLGITGLKAGDLIGYTGALMLLVVPLFVVPLMLF